MSLGPFKSFQRRSEVALAEAIIPGSRRIPAADEATVDKTEKILAEALPVLATAFRAAQALLNVAAIRDGGRPFPLLSAEAQDRLLLQWENDSIMSRPLSLVEMAYKFAHFDERSVYEAMGGRFNAVTNLESPRWLSQVHRADEWDGERDAGGFGVLRDKRATV